jgi:hypothetical protein
MRAYAIAWVDDIWLTAESFEQLKVMHSVYQEFVNFYTMKFVPDKCHVYAVCPKGIKRNVDEWKLPIVNYNNEVASITLVESEKSFRCLGAWFDTQIRWKKHVAHIKTSLKNFSDLMCKGYSPAALTTKLVNSNGLPKITYAMSLTEMHAREVREFQGLLIKPIKSDDRHSYLVPYAAYCMPTEMMGYRVASVSAVYKASKASGLYSFLNSAYELTRFSMKMHLLNLQRNMCSPYFPLSPNFKGWKA